MPSSNSMGIRHIFIYMRMYVCMYECVFMKEGTKQARTGKGCLSNKVAAPAPNETAVIPNARLETWAHGCKTKEMRRECMDRGGKAWGPC